MHNSPDLRRLRDGRVGTLGRRNRIIGPGSGPKRIDGVLCDGVRVSCGYETRENRLCRVEKSCGGRIYSCCCQCDCFRGRHGL